MSKTEPTPEAWTYHIGEDYTAFYDSGNHVLFMVYCQLDEKLATLIVAAPETASERNRLKKSQTELVSLCKRFLCVAENGSKYSTSDIQELITQTEVAITKATEKEK